MSRYRPPAPKASPYITAAGYNELEDESKSLWEKRARVASALATAAAEGDRSENAEYIYRKKELRGIDRRIRYLQRRMPVLKVVSQPPTDRNSIFFGASIVLEDRKGCEVRIRIVGTDELQPDKGWISIDSPMARALLKKKMDEEVAVQTPEGIQHYTVIDVQYPLPDK